MGFPELKILKIRNTRLGCNKSYGKYWKLMVGVAPPQQSTSQGLARCNRDRLPRDKKPLLNYFVQL